ncbi:MAG TPA: DUF2946 family protein [Stellaceae bacterium]|nr:DUF2946 family protein [Stellaceae bacterium]
MRGTAAATRTRRLLTRQDRQDLATLLSLLAVLANILLPILWLATESEASIETAFICHVPSADDSQGNSSTGDPLAPHCPLCVLFGGSLLAPTLRTEVAIVAPATYDLVLWQADEVAAPPAAPPHLRPGPRAPPTPS